MKADPEDSIVKSTTERRSSTIFLRLWRRQWFFVCVLLLCLMVSCSAAGNSQIPSDIAALLSIKASLRDPRGILNSWNTGAISAACTGGWVGVKCDSGNVVALHLPSKGLAGELSSDVGSLPFLRQLSLHHNAITGPIPATISSLRNLRGLYLFHNFFTGAIPATLSPVLQAMDLSHNQLSGAIPDSLASSSALLRRLDLSFNNLSSSIPESLTSLTRLQDFSLSHNSLSGSIPPQFSQLTLLRTIDLSSNSLSGNFPSLAAATHASPSSVVHFVMSRRASTSPSSSPSAVFPSLIVMNFSRNELTGPLPAQIGNLPLLLTLDLSHNNFSGTIPAEIGNVTDISTIDISYNNFSGQLPSSLNKLSNLTSFNCSFNSLTGPVPRFRHSMPATAFLGNIGLCGFSLSSTCPTTSPATGGPSANSSSSTQQAEAAAAAGKKKFSPLSIVFIVIGVVIVLFLVLCVCSLLFLCCCRRSEVPSSGYLGDKAGQGAGAGKKEGEIGGKLVHFEGSLGFAADDLLCATAEVLGKSTYGTVYKATLEDGSQVAVKRLREGIVKSQKDFESEVAVLGAIRHPNLLALRAYYWGPKDEKLLIFDFMQGGSLAAFIHARGPETPLTWQTRMGIAIGAARGLAHLHDQEKTVHGNLTSSNILIDGHLNAKLSDFGLSRLMTPAANSNVISTAGSLGYRAPELTKIKKASPKSDIYSFGIVLLELLTGKAPGEGPSTGEGAMDLPDWVASIVKQEWTHEVFDVELMKGRPPGDEELINTLQLAMACVKLNPMERPNVSDVLGQLEQIRPDLRQ